MPTKRNFENILAFAILGYVLIMGVMMVGLCQYALKDLRPLAEELESLNIAYKFSKMDVAILREAGKRPNTMFAKTVSPGYRWIQVRLETGEENFHLPYSIPCSKESTFSQVGPPGITKRPLLSIPPGTPHTCTAIVTIQVNGEPIVLTSPHMLIGVPGYAGVTVSVPAEVRTTDHVTICRACDSWNTRVFTLADAWEKSQLFPSSDPEHPTEFVFTYTIETTIDHLPPSQLP